MQKDVNCQGYLVGKAGLTGHGMNKWIKNKSIEPVTVVKNSHKAVYKHNSPFLSIKEFFSFSIKVRFTVY